MNTRSRASSSAAAGPRIVHTEGVGLECAPRTPLLFQPGIYGHRCTRLASNAFLRGEHFTDVSFATEAQLLATSVGMATPAGFAAQSPMVFFAWYARTARALGYPARACALTIDSGESILERVAGHPTPRFFVSKAGHAWTIIHSDGVWWVAEPGEGDGTCAGGDAAATVRRFCVLPCLSVSTPVC